MKTYRYNPYDEHSGRVLASSPVKGSGGSSTQGGASQPGQSSGSKNTTDILRVHGDKPKLAIENFFKKREWTTLRYEQLVMSYDLAFRRFHDAFSDFLEKAIFTSDTYLPDMAKIVKGIRNEYSKTITSEKQTQDVLDTQHYNDVLKKYNLDPKKPLPFLPIPELQKEMQVGKDFEPVKPIVRKSLRYLESEHILKKLTSKDNLGNKVYPNFDLKRFDVDRKAFESFYGSQTEARIFEAREELQLIFSSALDDMLMKYPWYMIYNEDRCNTAWTDGKSIGISPIYFEFLTNEEIQFVILHECFHCVFSHMQQGAEEQKKIDKDNEEIKKKYEEAKAKDPKVAPPLLLIYNHQIMNIAMDHEVNSFIKYSLFRGDAEKKYVDDQAILFEDNAIPGKLASEITAIDAYRALVQSLLQDQKGGSVTQGAQGPAIYNPSTNSQIKSNTTSKRYINKNIY